MVQIEKLTPEQEALIPFYREKWRKIALSTEPIERQKATEAVKAAYAAIGKPRPEIIFCSNPYIGLDFVNLIQSQKLLTLQLRNQLIMPLLEQLKGQQEKQLRKQLAIQIRKQVWGQTRWQLETQIREQVKGVSELEEQSYNYVNTSGWAYISFLCDFYISALNCICRQTEWSAIQSLIKYCGWILPFEKTCIVCDHPRKLSFDDQQRLHAEGEPAIQFVDGYSLYSYHGVTIPEKYGKLRPNQWQAKWLLEEDNAELRQVLIQGIGYSRICQELQAI